MIGHFFAILIVNVFAFHYLVLVHEAMLAIIYGLNFPICRHSFTYYTASQYIHPLHGAVTPLSICSLIVYVHI